MKIKKVKELLNNKEINAKDIIDVREVYEYKNGNIRGSKNIPLNNLLQNPAKYLDKNQKYYLICQSGSRSLSAFIILKFKGYKVKNISGGYLLWQQTNI